MVFNLGTPKIGRSDILLGIVVIVAIIMVVTLFLSQLQGFVINTNLSHAEILQINGLGKDPKLGTLIVYVENIGKEACDISSDYAFEVNDINIPLTEEAIDKKVLNPGQIATINIPFKISSGIPIVVKIIGEGTIFAESKIDNSDLLLNSYVLSVNIQGNSSNKVTKIPDQLSYPSGASVSLLAEPRADWSFSDWSGDVLSVNNPLTVVVDSNKNIYANFAEKIAPPPDVDPPKDIEETVRVTFSLTGIDSNSVGTILTIESTAKSYTAFPVSLNIVKGSFLNYEFSESIISSISGERFALKSSIGPKSPLSAVSDVTIFAEFEKQYEVTLSVNPNIVDTTTQPEGIQWISAGKEVLIETSTSSSEFVFSFWNTSNSAIQFDEIGVHNTSIVVNGPGNISANYRIPTVMDWQMISNSIYFGGSQNLIGSISSLNTNSTVESLIGKNVTLIVTAPNSTQTEVMVPIYSMEGDSKNLFNYQFVPDAIGVWSVEASFNGDLIFGDSGIALTSFGVSEIPQFLVSFEQSGIDDLNITTSVRYSIDGGQTQVSTVPFAILVNLDSIIEYTYQEDVFGEPGTKYQLLNVNNDEKMTITESIDIIGSYKTQYLFIFDQIGLDDSALGTIVLADGEVMVYDDLPVTDWFDSETTYRYSSVVSGGKGKRFVLTSPIGVSTITATGSVNGIYETQYLFEVFSPVGLGVAEEGWYNDGSVVSSSVISPFIVVGPPKIEYNSLGYDGTGSVPDGDETSVKFVIDKPSSITWKWEGKIILYADGTIDEGIPNSAGFTDHWKCVSDYGNSDDANTVYAIDPPDVNSEYYIDIYSLEDVGSMVGKIESVSVNARLTSMDGDADARVYLGLNGEVKNSKEFDLTQNWDDYSYASSKPGGGSWSWEDINELECGVGLQMTRSDEYAACTLVWVEVKFTV